MNRSKTTTDHDEIRRWAEQRRGTPVAVKGTSRGKRDPGILRIDFPGYAGEGKLEQIGWDEWFQKFDDNKLALVLQEETADGEKSNFNKIVSRTHARPRPAKKPRTSSAHRTRSARSARAERGKGGAKRAR